MSEQKGTRPPFENWCVVELMGHVRLAGHVTEQELFGAKLGRIEIPQKDGTYVSQFFGGGSVYRISPVSEEVARHIAASTSYMPVHAWELPKPAIEHKPEEPSDRTCSDCGLAIEECDCLVADDDDSYLDDEEDVRGIKEPF